MADNIHDCLEDIMALDGALGAALVDWTSGGIIEATGTDDLDLIERSALGDAEVVLAKVAVMGTFETIDPIEDIIITLEKQYHVIRLLKVCPSRFLYAVLDRSRANLSQVRMKLAEIEDILVFQEEGWTRRHQV